MRCRDEWDLLRRHYRYVAVLACVEQHVKMREQVTSTKIAGISDRCARLQIICRL
jgi:hypothetical protein